MKGKNPTEETILSCRAAEQLGAGRVVLLPRHKVFHPCDDAALINVSGISLNDYELLVLQ